MRRSRGPAALALVGSILVATCIYPTEHDSAVHVSITPLGILIRGTDTVATAQAWRMVGPADSQPIANVVFVWSSSDATVATVSETGRIVGIKSGTAIITAAAANFDRRALAAADTVRVSAPLEVDSIRPLAPRYGGLVTVYGPGADSILLATLHGVPLFPYPFSETRDTTGYGSKQFWLLPPAQSDTMILIGSGIVTSNQDTTRVIRQDVYEPNETAPHNFDLDAPRPFPYPTTFWYPFLVVNPGLFFEPLQRGDTVGVDWYRFGHATARDVTIILSAPSVPGTFATFVTDSLTWNGTSYGIPPDGWTFGPGAHACHGLPFSPSEANGDSTIVAFKNLPAGALHAITIYGQAAGYGLAVLDGYASELPADAHEDDNSCNAADLRGTLQSPFRDTLTIQNPHDVDWIRFHYTQGGLGSTARVRLHAFPGTHPDSLKDLDLYIIRVPQPSDMALQIVRADTAPGSEVNQTPSLATGDYYLAVVDFAGTTTTYEVCVGVVPLLGQGDCSNAVFPAPPAAAPPSVAPLRTKRRPAARRPLPAPITPSRR
jgi:Big-like domain-containing protein